MYTAAHVGSDADDAGDRRGSSSGGGGGPSAAEGSSTAPDDAATGASASGGSPAVGGVGAAGGEGAAGGGSDAGAGCAASASGEVGVTDDAIDIGAVFQLSGPVPGFAQEAVNGAQAYVAFTNATGGLCGRELRYQVADDGFEASANASRASMLKDKVLAFGAGYSIADSGMATALAGTNVADVSIAASPQRQGYEHNYTHLPAPGDTSINPEISHVAQQGVAKVMMVHAAAASARKTADIYRGMAQRAGLQVEMLEVSNTQFSWSGPARAVMDSGAQMMIFIHELNSSVQMAAEMRKLGPPLQFEWHRVSYGQEFINRAGANAEGLVGFLEFVPFEEAASNAEMATFIEWLQRVAPGVDPSFDAINGWISMKLLVDGIRGVDGDITRDNLLASLDKTTAFDAGGLIETMNPAAGTSGACKVVVRVENGRWVREAPASGFVC